MNTIPIIAQLSSTDEYDTDAPYVYLELDEKLLLRIEKSLRLYESISEDPILGLNKLTIHGPFMTTLGTLPHLTEEQQALLGEDESIILSASIPDNILSELEGTVQICGASIDILGCRCLYAVGNNKHTRDIYEANISAALRFVLESRHYFGKEYTSSC